MAVLFVGTSSSDFEITGVPVSTTTAAQKAANVAEGFNFNNQSLHQFAHAKFAATADIWASQYIYNTASPSNLNQIFWEWGNSVAPGVNQPLFRLTANGASGCTLDIWNGTTWVVGSTAAANVTTFNTLRRIDVHIKMHDTTGVFLIYVDGTLAATHTATDTILTAATTLDWMRIRSPGGSLGVTSYTSAILVADEDTRPLTVAQVLPSASGANSAWTGLFSAIDDTGIDDTDFISSDTLNAVSTYATPALASGLTGGTYTIVAVAISGRVSAKAGRDVALTLYTNTATYPATDGVDANLFLNPRQTIWHNNPATSTAWTPTEASGCQIGAKVINHA
jgi:hypothetical protein